VCRPREPLLRTRRRRTARGRARSLSHAEELRHSSSGPRIFFCDESSSVRLALPRGDDAVTRLCDSRNGCGSLIDLHRAVASAASARLRETFCVRRFCFQSSRYFATSVRAAVGSKLHAHQLRAGSRARAFGYTTSDARRAEWICRPGMGRGLLGELVCCAAELRRVEMRDSGDPPRRLQRRRVSGWRECSARIVDITRRVRHVVG